MQLIMKVSQQKKATKTAGAASRKTASSRTLLKLVKNDEWLAPYTEAIRGRHEQALRKIEELTQGKQTISDFALGHHYFGLHRTRKNWIFREWAPNATRIFLVGDCNDWQEHPDYELQRIEDSGNWELTLPAKGLKHGQLYKLHVYWDGGFGERIPSYANRVVQDEATKIFSAQVWDPAKPYHFKKENFKPQRSPLLIYECHI